MPKIFISYRHDDCPYEAVPIRDRLALHFGKDDVFFDVNSIRLGHNFRLALDQKVGCCDYLVALIGKSWLTICDDNGRRRLDDPDDWVRLEIEAALKREIPVVAVLLHNVRMPRRDELPSGLMELADRQAISIRPLADFNHDVERLIRDIDEQEKERSTQASVSVDTAARTLSAPSQPVHELPASAKVANTEVIATTGTTRATQELAFDGEFARRLPLPLAQLYGASVYAKSVLERHQSAFYLWEATLKLMGGAAVVAWAAGAQTDERISETLKSLARPSLGHWWGYSKTLVPRLAEGDPGFHAQNRFLFGKSRDDLPRLAGLDALLREILARPGGPRSMVKPRDLFDRIVSYRNQEIGHGAAGCRPRAFYDRVGPALLAGAIELLRQLDPLAGRAMIYVGEVCRADDGGWSAENFDLRSEWPRPCQPVRWGGRDQGELLDPHRLYLRGDLAGPETWVPFHPLAVFDREANDFLILNGRARDHCTDYLSYRNGTNSTRADLPGEQRELLARLLGIEISSSQLEQLADATPSDEKETLPEATATGRFIGDFELLTRLGKGGMGVVYRARQAVVGREVALKCQLRVGDEATDRRFQREILALGRVSHPNLVRVYASGNDGDQWYYAMELVEGATLATFNSQLKRRSHNPGEVSAEAWRETLSVACDYTRKEEKPIAPDRASPVVAEALAEPPRTVDVVDRDYVTQVVDLLRQAADGAHALHESGVIHRDIKPDNIMVSMDGRHAYLMDLGLAHVIEQGKGQLTRSRQFLGSLPYASPEQVAATGPVDPRTDIYSLGATLWELLTFRTLFNATDDTPPPELMRRIQFDLPLSPRRLNPRISRDLDAVVLRCLEKNPSLRYSTAGALSDDLSRILRGEAAEASAGSFRRAWRKATRAARPLRPFLPYIVAATFVGLLWIAPKIRPPQVSTDAAARTEPPAKNDGNSSVGRRPEPAAGSTVASTAKVVVPAAPSGLGSSPEKKADNGIQPGLPIRTEKTAAPRLAPIPQPESYAVLVGVQQAADARGPKNEFSEKDIEDAAGALAAAGFERDRIIVLTKSRGQKDKGRTPTKRNIEQELASAVKKVGANGMLLFAYSGNGVTAGGTQRLITADSSMADLNSLLDLDKYARSLSFGSRARFTLGLIDACRTDLGGSHRGIVSENDRTAWIFSTQPGEKSYEDKAPIGGVFFHFVNRALRGEADLNQDRRLTVNELWNFVRRGVHDYVKSHLKLEQKPAISHDRPEGDVLVQWRAPRGYALLVGCSHLDFLTGQQDLNGPANDVRLAADVLERSFGFRPEDIVVLSEQAGGEDRPVRRAIEREFQALAQKANSGDEIVVLLSGRATETDDGPLFLSADFRHLSGERGPDVKTGIGTAELREWGSAITASGAHLLVVIDACRVGGMLRGGAEGIVAIYGAESDQVAVERPMPPDNKYYGLLTNTLCRLLEKSGRRGISLTYRELGLRLQSEYAAQGRTGAPYVEGSSLDLDREVLGSAAHESRSRIALARDEVADEWTVNVGRALGVTKGCVLAVYPPADDANSDKPVGHVVVSSEGFFESIVKPVKYADLPEPKTLPRDGRCALVGLDFGDLRLLVAVDRPKSAAGDAAGRISPAQRDLLTKIENELRARGGANDAIFRFVDKLHDANWIVQFRADRLWLVPADAALLSERQLDQSSSRPFLIGQGHELEEVVAKVNAIARGQNLVDLAGQEASASAEFAYLGYTPPSAQHSLVEKPQIRVEMLKCKNAEDKVGQLIPETDLKPNLQAGDYVAFRARNVGRVAVDLSLLFVDADFGIAEIFPRRPGDANRLPAAGRGDATTVQVGPFRVNDLTVGHEHLVAIAVPADAGSPPIDFGFLAAPTPAGGKTTKFKENTLGDLLQKAAFGEGSARGLTGAGIEKLDLKLISWTVGKRSR